MLSANSLDFSSSMTMNFLPPQAYTKDMLAQAYNWLRSQPNNVQEMAKSPDTLVALYQKAQMHGDSFFERPSLQNFKSELKNLAGMMGEFDGKTNMMNSNPSPQASFQINPGFSNQNQFQSPQQQSQLNHNVGSTSPMFTAGPSAPMMAAPSNAPVNGSLDQRSLLMIQEVKEQFNLSSENEALRFLIAFGYQKLKSTF